MTPAAAKAAEQLRESGVAVAEVAKADLVAEGDADRRLLRAARWSAAATDIREYRGGPVRTPSWWAVEIRSRVEAAPAVDDASRLAALRGRIRTAVAWLGGPAALPIDTLFLTELRTTCRRLYAVVGDSGGARATAEDVSNARGEDWCTGTLTLPSRDTGTPSWSGVPEELKAKLALADLIITKRPEDSRLLVDHSREILKPILGLHDARTPEQAQREFGVASFGVVVKLWD